MAKEKKYPNIYEAKYDKIKKMPIDKLIKKFGYEQVCKYTNEKAAELRKERENKKD